jgi:hypothetical protein
MKSWLAASLSNHCAQVSPVGVMTHERPRRTISTVATPSGSRTDFGSRTVCLLFVVKTEPRAMISHLSLDTHKQVYTGSIHDLAAEVQVSARLANATITPDR